MPYYTNFFWATFFISYDPLEFSTGACPTPSGLEMAKTHHCALCQHEYRILHVSKNCHFWTHLSSLITDVIYWWSLRQRYFENMKDYAKFCSELEEFEACNLRVCPEPTASPNVIDSKYNTMDCQWCPNERPIGKTIIFLQLLKCHQVIFHLKG